jgi:hypothetical protein
MGESSCVLVSLRACLRAPALSFFGVDFMPQRHDERRTKTGWKAKNCPNHPSAGTLIPKIYMPDADKLQLMALRHRVFTQVSAENYFFINESAEKLLHIP